MLAFPGGDPPAPEAEAEPVAPPPATAEEVEDPETGAEVVPPQTKRPRREKVSEPEVPSGEWQAPEQPETEQEEAEAKPAEAEGEPSAAVQAPAPVMPEPLPIPPGMEAAFAAGAAAPTSPAEFGDLSSRKARLVWTQELHNRFINALSHLGLKQAVPKNILAMMNVEGMTRENVASHLQKYRLYLKKMGGFNEKERVDIDSLQRLHEQNVAQMAAQQAMQQSLSGGAGSGGATGGSGSAAGTLRPAGATPPFPFVAPGVEGGSVAGGNPSSPLGGIPPPPFPAMFGLPLPGPGAPGARPILPPAALTLPPPPFPLPVPGSGPAAATSSSSKDGTGGFLPLVTDGGEGKTGGEQGAEGVPAGLQPPPGVPAMPPLWQLPPPFRVPGTGGDESQPAAAGEESQQPAPFLPPANPHLWASMWQMFGQGLPGAPGLPDGNGGLAPPPFPAAFPWPFPRLPTPAQQGSSAPEVEGAKEGEAEEVKQDGEEEANDETEAKEQAAAEETEPADQPVEED